MYTVKDIFNLRSSNYKITPIDERIYNETGYAIHQADKKMIEYKHGFGTTYGKITVEIYKNGKITAIYIILEIKMMIMILKLLKFQKVLKNL